LTVKQVAWFWHSFRNSRDLSIVGLMVLHDLRSREVLALNADDLLTRDSQIRVTGKAPARIERGAASLLTAHRACIRTQ
jgi:site-specific recombinase XerC